MERVLQHGADQYAHTECEYHQQGNAGIAVTVFLDEVDHTVEKRQHDGKPYPARTEGGVKIETGIGGKCRACGCRNE